MKTSRILFLTLCALLSTTYMLAADAVATAKIEARDALGVLKYSAEPGNFSTAIDAAGANGTVTIGEGVVVLSSLKDIANSVTIIGAGTNATTITGKESSYNNPTNGCGMTTKGSISSSLKALIRIGGSNSDVVVNIRDLTIDGGTCGGTYKLYGFLSMAHDFDIIRVNGGASPYTVNIYNCVLKGAKAKSIMQVGTGSSKGYVSMYNCKVSKSGSQFYADMDVTNNGSWTKAYNTYFEGLVEGDVSVESEHCLYKYTQSYQYGVNGGSTTPKTATFSSTIEGAIDWYNTHHSLAAMAPALMAVDGLSGKNTLQAMTDDLCDCNVTICLQDEVSKNKFAVMQEFRDVLYASKSLLASNSVDVQGLIDALDAKLSLGEATYLACGATTIEDKHVVKDEIYTPADGDEVLDLYVHPGSIIEINDGVNFTCQNIYLEATQGQSGQILKYGSGHLQYQGDVYLDINFSNDNHAMDGSLYYGFSVPFPVDIVGGIVRVFGDGHTEAATPNDIFRFRTFNSQARADGADEFARWDFVTTGQLQPGVYYMADFVDASATTYRFKMASGASLNLDDAANVHVNMYSSNDQTAANWNAIGNPILCHAQISGISGIYIYKHGTNAFNYVDFNDPSTSLSLVVGAPCFVQATEERNVTFSRPNQTSQQLFMASREQETGNRLTLRLNDRGEDYDDQLYITYSDDAENEYTIGRDAAKLNMGTPRVSQLWVEAYGTRLAKYNAPADKKDIALQLSAPKAGYYTLSALDIPEGTLYLLHDGQAIANLSMMDYDLYLSQGTNTGYSLRIEPNRVSTGMDEFNAETENAKVLRNGQLFIMRGEHEYTIEGMMVK